MSIQRQSILQHFIGAFCYPDSHYSETVQDLWTMISASYPEVAEDFQPFHEFVTQHQLEQLEENFTRTFEINAQCALEMGWHLFGEEYLRGLFLVRLRELLRQHSIPESSELPDHLTHVLAVLAAMSHDEAAKLAAACVLPALDKMLQAFAGKQNPYEHLLSSLRWVLCREFDLPDRRVHHDNSDRSETLGDPLWRYPVQRQSLGGDVQFVPLELRYGDAADSCHVSIAGGKTT